MQQVILIPWLIVLKETTIKKNQQIHTCVDANSTDFETGKTGVDVKGF